MGRDEEGAGGWPGPGPGPGYDLPQVTSMWVHLVEQTSVAGKAEG